jgi:hypothetical protein
MTLRLTLPLLIYLLISVAGCKFAQVGVQGSGVSKTESREVANWHGVVVRGSADVHVTIGEPASLTVTADDNILPLIITEVEGGKLIIRTEKSYTSRTGVRVSATIGSLKSASVEGSGDITIKGLREEAFSVAIAGSGKVVAEGSADTTKVAIAGSGDVVLDSLQSRTVTVSIAGSGDARVGPAEELTVSIAGSGDVRYSGDPKVTTKIAGSGSVQKSR